MPRHESDIIAVDEFDADIEDGEFGVVVGPSSCGKSTTLRCIAGLENPTLYSIEELLGKNPGDLSAGRQQRVALGRAVVREPEVFLMDETLSNLDTKLRTQMHTELQEMQQEFGVTTIYVTHDQTEAMTTGDQIVILDGSELQQIGTPLEYCHEPVNHFVAGFIGSPSANFFKIELDTSGVTPTLVHDAFECELDDVSSVPVGVE